MALCKTFLKAYNFDINLADDFGRTALHYVVANGHKELFEFFISKGSDIYRKTKENTNCLHIAASGGHVDICKEILRTYEFDINAANDNGWTALHCGLHNGNFELFQLLIENKSDIYSTSKDNTNCLHIAALGGHIDICKEILRTYEFDINAANDNGWTALHYGLCNGNFELFQLLIENKSDIYSTSKDNTNCLHIAVSEGHIDICKEILKTYKIDINAANNNGWTALHYGVQNGNFELLKLLIQNGGDVYYATKDNTNCLHLATSEGHIDICKMFLNGYKFDINAANNDGWTALHFGVENGNFELFKLIIQNGINIYIRTNCKMTSLHIASKEGHLKICQCIVAQYNYDVSKKRSEYDTYTKDKTLFRQIFLDKFLNARTTKGNTSLHLAVLGSHVDVSKFLLKCDVDITYENIDGDIPRDIAKREGYQSVLDVMKDKYDRLGKQSVLLHSNEVYIPSLNIKII